MLTIITRNISDSEKGVLRLDPELARDLDVLLIAKGLNEDTIAETRRQRLKEVAREESSALWSLFDCGRKVEPAPYLAGAIFRLKLDRDEISDIEAIPNIQCSEPFDVAFYGKTIVAAMADHLAIVDVTTDFQVRILRHQWFAQLHSVAFSHCGSRLLLTSGDFDSILEVMVETGEVLWRWTSWENGYPEAPDGTYIASSKEEYELVRQKTPAILFGDFYSPHFLHGLATGSQPLHINAAVYSSHGSVLATTFHKGAIIEINMQTMYSIVRIDG